VALRNRKDIETSKLKGVVLATDPIKLEFGRFTQLANWIPADIDSLKKKRGVLALISNLTSPVHPIPCEIVGGSLPHFLVGGGDFLLGNNSGEGLSNIYGVGAGLYGTGTGLYGTAESSGSIGGGEFLIGP
jgi:hypothetical protein